MEKHLPWFKVKNKTGDSRHITIRQALSHTAGVFRDGVTPHWETDKFPDERQLRKSISNKTIVFENQTRFKYSNFGFALLGEVIKKVSGMSYEEYVTHNIIQRLNLENTAPDLNPKIVARLAKGYARPIPNEKRQSFSHVKTNAYASATGFVSNVIDLAKFLSALTVARQGEKGENTILDRESKKEMMREYWKATEEGDFYGLGLGIYKIEKRKVVGHGGGFAGFITRVSLDIENDIGVITLSNTNDSSAGAINIGIFETIYDLVDDIDDKDIYADVKKLPDEKKYEGAYRSRWNDRIIVGINGKLVAFDPKVNSPLKNKTLLKPRGKDRFIMETKFNFDSPGEIAKFVFEKGEARAKKLIWGSTPLERLERSIRY
jgi:CubicO group peptidase (beta-lactamase class C family)